MKDKTDSGLKSKDTTCEIDLKQQYYFYGKIRYIVSDGRCDKLKVVDVARDITREHYERINNLYGLEKNEVDIIIKNMTPLQKVES